MKQKPNIIRDSQEHLNPNPSRQSFSQPQPKAVNVNQLVFQISEYENQSDIKEKSFVIQTSFAQEIPDSIGEKTNTNSFSIQKSPLQKNRKQLIKNFLGNLPKTDPTTLEEELNKIQNIEQTKKQSEEFILNFNKKPALAIQELIQKLKKTKSFFPKEAKQEFTRTGFKKKSTKVYQSSNPQSEKEIQELIFKAVAEHLLKIEGLDKTALGQYFGKNDKKVLHILHEYCSLLDFRKKDFDQALRDLLSKFRLPGESQQIQRIIWQFSQSFYDQNKNAADNPDELFHLAYSIIMLATDAHNPKQYKKMTVEDFVKNTQRACPSTKQDYLRKIYHRITEKKLETSISNWQLEYGRLKDMNPLEQSKDYENQAKELKKGLIMLKVCRQNPRLPFSNPKQSKFVQRKIYLSEDLQRLKWIKDPSNGDEQPRFIEIDDIIDLTLGIDAEMMKQKKVPIEFDSVFFTIKTRYRALHLKAKSTKQRSLLINYLRVVMIQKRQSRVQEEQANQEQILSNKAIEEAWNQDIFPHWDRYWDYTLKKPKRKSYFARGVEVICGCFKSNDKDEEETEQQHYELGISIKNNLLETLWKYGLPPKARQILWAEMIGNTLELNQILIQDIKFRKIYSEKLRNFKISTMIEKNFLDQKHDQKESKNQKSLPKIKIQQKINRTQETIYEMAQNLLTVRPDLPHVKDLLLMSKVFYEVLQNEEQMQDSQKETQKNINSHKQQQLTASVLLSAKGFKKPQMSQNNRTSLSQKLTTRQIANPNSIICLINLIHKHHFLAFYRGDKVSMRARFSLFQKLMEINAKAVLHHFEYIKLETKMFLVSWFLSVFASCFEGEFLWRIWDNYLLQEELYLFKVGISIVKYFQIELKMATFSQSLDLLKKPPHISPPLFFQILENEIHVDQKLYANEIESIKHGKIKQSVNQIPLK